MLHCPSIFNIIFLCKNIFFWICDLDMILWDSPHYSHVFFIYCIYTNTSEMPSIVLHMLISSTFPSICFPSERKGEGWMFGYFLAQCRRWLNCLSLKLPQEMIATLQNLSCSVHSTHRNKLISIFNYTACTAGISYCCVDNQNTSVFCRNDVVGV